MAEESETVSVYQRLVLLKSERRPRGLDVDQVLLSEQTSFPICLYKIQQKGSAGRLEFLLINELPNADISPKRGGENTKSVESTIYANSNGICDLRIAGCQDCRECQPHLVKW